MNIHPYTWIITVVVLVGVLIVDAVVIGRRPHVPSTKECSKYISAYIILALLFGAGIWLLSGAKFAQEFYAGWLTEYSLSLDNLFIFLIIMEKQRVPRHVQQFALMVGIMLSLLFRGGFIALGAVLIDKLAWVFFLFGAYLLYTAWGVLKDFRSGGGDESKGDDGVVLRLIKTHIPTTNTWEGDKILVRRDGRLLFTLVFFTILTLGATDVMFALDSIPAIFGLTVEPYIVFTANVFALMGLRQLYFLLGDLLDRLYYLPVGLFVLLGYIGVKLLLHAAHHYQLDENAGLVGLVALLVAIAVAAAVCIAIGRGATALARRLGCAGHGLTVVRIVAWIVGVVVAAAALWEACPRIVDAAESLSRHERVAFNGEIPTIVSLGGIVVILGVTAVVSILKTARDKAKAELADAG